MPLTIIRSAPELERYTLLSIHQSQTPASFSIPILHFRNENCKLVLAKDQSSLLPIFGCKATADKSEATGRGSEQVEVDKVDVWVTSENLILYNTFSFVGATVPYTSITLHAVQRISQGTGIYMQISLSPTASQTTNNETYDEGNILELTVIPLPTGEDDRIDAFFRALSDCANLHPDPDNSSTDGEMESPIIFEGVIGYERGARLEGFPGEGGWVTAENVDQFHFGDGEDIGGEGSTTILGPGAGTVRLREEEPSEPGDQSSFHGGAEEAKWRKTE